MLVDRRLSINIYIIIFYYLQINNFTTNINKVKPIKILYKYSIIVSFQEFERILRNIAQFKQLSTLTVNEEISSLVSTVLL